MVQEIGDIKGKKYAMFDLFIKGNNFWFELSAVIGNYRQLSGVIGSYREFQKIEA